MADKKLVKTFLICTGLLSLVLGIVGIILPLLPTTPFLLLSAACFAKSSVKLHTLLLRNKYLGRHIRDYQENKGVRLHIKIIAITVLWLSVGYSALFVISAIFARVLLLLIAVAVTVHILRLKSLYEPKKAVHFLNYPIR